MFLRRVGAPFLAGALLMTAACSTGSFNYSGGPFSYSKDRCVGSYNQCQTECASLNDGPARAACADRCMTLENRCYGTGDDSPSALSVDSAIGAARSERDKEEGYREWKAQKERESAEKQKTDQEQQDDSGTQTPK